MIYFPAEYGVNQVISHCMTTKYQPIPDLPFLSLLFPFLPLYISHLTSHIFHHDKRIRNHHSRMRGSI